MAQSYEMPKPKGSVASLHYNIGSAEINKNSGF